MGIGTYMFEAKGRGMLRDYAESRNSIAFGQRSATARGT